ncbi:MAG TPA: DUF1127 domain-containing protein [Aestuariivirga sp.]|nr:DUF1127 domain-containing protein [Aestuariivirga sp.]
MLLKLKIAATEHTPVNRVWSALVAFVRARRQRACDRRILTHMNNHNLRDLGLSRSQGSSYPRSRPQSHPGF